MSDDQYAKLVNRHIRDVKRDIMASISSDHTREDLTDFLTILDADSIATHESNGSFKFVCPPPPPPKPPSIWRTLWRRLTFQNPPSSPFRQ